jgi:hypothetical protein
MAECRGEIEKHTEQQHRKEREGKRERERGETDHVLTLSLLPSPLPHPSLRVSPTMLSPIGTTSSAE